MKDTKDSKKSSNSEEMTEESIFPYIEGLDIDSDLNALDIAGEAFQAY